VPNCARFVLSHRTDRGDSAARMPSAGVLCTADCRSWGRYR